MKRNLCTRSIPNTKRSKKKAAGDVATKRNFTLTDLADDLLIKAFSYLSFKDRHVSRRVCKGLLQFVDKSTPGANLLCVELGPELDIKNTSKVHMKATELVRDAVNLDIKLDQIYRSRRLQRAQLTALLQHVPPLRSIRPIWLQFRIKSEIGQGETFPMLMQHLVSQQVASSVSNIFLKQECPLESLTDVQQACTVFDRSSDVGVQSLKLSGRPYLLLPVATFFPRLVDLEFQFRTRYYLQRKPRDAETDAEEFIRGLAILSSHSELHALRISRANVFLRSSEGMKIQGQMMARLASFANLHQLYCRICCRHSRFKTEGEHERFIIAFGNMLRGMSSLQSLGKLVDPGSKFWGKIREHSIMFNGIGKLEIKLGTLNGVEAMVQGLLSCAPLLTTLSLQVGRSSTEFEERVFQALSGLRQHPTLDELKLHPVEIWQGLHPRLQQELGTEIKVCLF